VPKRGGPKRGGGGLERYTGGISDLAQKTLSPIMEERDVLQNQKGREEGYVSIMQAQMIFERLRKTEDLGENCHVS